MALVYDCFMFFNELELLEIRLNELETVVDKYVLVESRKTFTNKLKPLYFEKNKKRFNKFSDKIIHLIIDEFPENYSAWDCEVYQRNFIREGLKNCAEDDVIVIGDVDEIPNPEAIKKSKDLPGIKVLKQKQYNFYLNYINSNEPDWLRGSRVLFYKDFDKTADEVRNTQGQVIENGGWHFTFLGGIKAVQNKIRSFSHQEYNNDYYMNENRLQKLIQDGVDIFERGYKYKIVNIDKSFPESVRKNKEKYSHLILKKSSVFHRVKNALIPPKRQDKRYINTIKPINDNPILDFISPTAEKFLEIGEGDLKKLIENKFSPIQYEQTDPLNVDQVNNLPENNFDCAILDETISQVLNPVDVLTIIKSKLNRNGYVIMTVPNFRHISVLNQILFKKTLKYEENGILSVKNNKFFTRKSLFDLIHSSGYYIVTFKGLKPIDSIDYRIKNTLMFGNLYDCRHKKFLVVIKH